MKNLKLTKAKIVVFLVLILILVSVIFFTTNNKLRDNLLGRDIKQENEEVLPPFSYVVYDNQDKQKIKVLITFNSEEGIEYIEYPNGDILNVNGKSKIEIDYVAKEEELYRFGVKEINKDKVNRDMLVDNNIIQENELGINIKTDVSGYKIIDISKKINIGNFGDVQYKIGENGTWVKGEEFSMLDYDLTQNELVNDDDTVTIFAKVTDSRTNDVVTVEQKYDVITTEKVANIQADSLIQAMSDNNFENGKYAVTVSDETYNLKVYNIDGSVEMSVNTTIGVEKDVGKADIIEGEVVKERGYAQNMIVLKVNGDLTIGENATLTPYASSTGHGGPKGMMIYCTGTITNNGTINMTARGAYAEGQNVYLWKNANGSYEYVPAEGGSGGAASRGQRSQR